MPVTHEYRSRRCAHSTLFWVEGGQAIRVCQGIAVAFGAPWEEMAEKGGGGARRAALHSGTNPCTARAIGAHTLSHCFADRVSARLPTMDPPRWGNTVEGIVLSSPTSNAVAHCSAATQSAMLIIYGYLSPNAGTHCGFPQRPLCFHTTSLPTIAVPAMPKPPFLTPAKTRKAPVTTKPVHSPHFSSEIPVPSGLAPRPAGGTALGCCDVVSAKKNTPPSQPTSSCGRTRPRTWRS